MTNSLSPSASIDSSCSVGEVLFDEVLEARNMSALWMPCEVEHRCPPAAADVRRELAGQTFLLLRYAVVVVKIVRVYLLLRLAINRHGHIFVPSKSQSTPLKVRIGL